MIKYVLMWFPLLVTAFANGALRQMTYAKVMSEAWARGISVFSGIILTGAVMWLMLSRWKPATRFEAFIGGIIWLVMTEAFEFTMTVALMKKPVAFFVNMHNIQAGELWPLFLVWLLVAPPSIYTITRNR